MHVINQQKEEKGVCQNLCRELRFYDDRHKQYLRMRVNNFDHIMRLIEHKITKQDTTFRKAIKPELKLAVTLHHPAEGAT